MDSCQPDTSLFTVGRYQKLWKSYVKLRHLLANSPKVKQIDKQKLTQREVGRQEKNTLLMFCIFPFVTLIFNTVRALLLVM